MEILNLIRNTLFSPNKLFTTILGIPLTFIDAYVGFLLFSTVLDISYTNKQKWAYILYIKKFYMGSFRYANKYDSMAYMCNSYF